MENKKITNIVELEKIAVQVRKKILTMIYRGRTSHIGSAMSCVDILTALYYNIMNIDPKNPDDINRDICILSKGNGAAALYAVLGLKGFFSQEILGNYCFDGSKLIGHTDLQVAGVEASTGSLGHGLPMGVGFAIAAKNDARPTRVFIVHGDGECNEGSVWEAVMAAAKYKLDNLIVIVDTNKLQATGYSKDVMPMEPLPDKFEAFGWKSMRIDGHNMAQIVDALSKVPFEKDKPSVIVADTIKAKGLKFFENQLISHYRPPSDEQYKIAMEDFNKLEEELNKKLLQGVTNAK